jgi:TM2 domain-containing membrane protein YozV
MTFASSNYTLDNQKVDKLFDNAVEVSLNELASSQSNLPSGITTINQDDETTKVLIGWIVCWTGLSAFGVHRHVLGTKPNMWATYTFTVCGIFGIVPFIDWWVLLIDGLIMENGEKYIDNEDFFMWG